MTPSATLQRVFVRGLRLDIEIGVHSHEHGRTQPVVVDVELDVEGVGSERLADTVNYEMVVTAAREAAVGHTLLVEGFAERLAGACLQDERVRRVRVRAEKPDAFEEAAGAGFELVLER
jgi:dihydroneopterin aldolase